MIILDTNVISEPMRPTPRDTVIAWLNGQQSQTMFTTTINIMELYAGLEKLHDGKRKTRLWAALDFTLSTLIGVRILPLDLPAAKEAVRIAVATEAAGLKTSVADGLIAAIAKTRGYAVATRDVDPFQDAGVTTINPWDSQSLT